MTIELILGVVVLVVLGLALWLAYSKGKLKGKEDIHEADQRKDRAAEAVRNQPNPTGRAVLAKLRKLWGKST